MNFKYWAILIILTLFTLNSFTDGAVNEKILELTAQIDTAEVSNQGACLVGLFIITPEWWVPSGDDLAIAIAITGALYWLFRKKWTFTGNGKIVVLLAVGVTSWFLYKLFGLYLVYSNPDCAALYSTGTEFLEGPLGIIVTGVLTLFALKWIIQRYR